MPNSLNIDLAPFSQFIGVFLAKNQHLNLVSHAQEAAFGVRHVLDSLALTMLVDQLKLNLNGASLLDLGSGGGLPALPLAIYYPQLSVTALDSIHKKVAAIQEMITALKLANITAVCARAETLQQTFNIVTARAVAPLSRLAPLASRLLVKGGIFAAYKGPKLEEELEVARGTLEKLNLQLITKISYTLPVPEHPVRYIAGFRKV